jgi:hypothetical protein
MYVKIYDTECTADETPKRVHTGGWNSKEFRAMNRLSYSILYLYTFLNANLAAKMLAGLKRLEVRWYWASLYKKVIIARDPRNGGFPFS